MFFKSEIFFVRILLSCMAGILIFYTFPLPFVRDLLLIIAITLLICLIIINSWYVRLKAYRFKWLTGLILFLFLFTGSGYLCLRYNQLNEKFHFSKQNLDFLNIIITNEPQKSTHYLRFTAEITTGFSRGKQQRASGKLMIILKTDDLKQKSLNYGDELIIINNSTEVEPPYNLAEFDFKDWLAAQNIHHQVFLTASDLFVTGQNNGNIMLKHAYKIRQAQVAKYRKLIKNTEAFAVASTLILGYRSDLDQETLAAYSKTGTIHALSVSGAHVAIIYLFLDYLFFFLEKKKSFKLLKVLVICTLLWFYAMLTGFSPSVLRAVIMITVFILSKLLNKSPNSYNILAFSAFCLLIYNPFLIFDVGFQLSYLAVIGLIYLQPLIYNIIYFKNRYIDKIWNLIALSLAAQLITFPLSIYYFHQFPVYFLVGNLFIMLPVNAIMALGAIVLIPGLEFPSPIFEWVINFTNSGLKWIANLPLSGISGIYINKAELILLSAALVLFVVAFQYQQKRLLFASIATLILFQACLAYDKLKAADQRLVIFYSLRKNYAAAFINGDKAILVTDLAVKDKNYQFFIKPGLEKLKIRSINILPFGKDTTGANFSSQYHQLQFYNYKVLILDSSLNKQSINDYPVFSAAWVHKNPIVNIQTLKQTVNTSRLIIDGTNKDYLIRRFSDEAEKTGFIVSLLKKNPAYLIDLK